MARRVLRNDQWERIAPLLPGKATDCGVTAKDNRQFLEAVLWIIRTGSPWRDLPSEYGHWLVCMSVIVVGPIREYGSKFSNLLPVILTWNI